VSWDLFAFLKSRKKERGKKGNRGGIIKELLDKLGEQSVDGLR
jgi:hypothetical protein